MNIPNLLTLSRIFALFLIAALLYADFKWASTLCFFLFIAATITDGLDGYMARKLNLDSDFGKFMDALADKVLIVGIFVCFLAAGYLPKWAIFPVLIILSREFLITGLRLIAASKGRVLAAEAAGKVKTCIQIVAACFVLLTHALKVDWVVPEAIVDIIENVGLGVFIFATLLTATSGYGYMKRNWSLLLDD